MQPSLQVPLNKIDSVSIKPPAGGVRCAPASPTDRMLSPCSRRLARSNRSGQCLMKRVLSPGAMLESKRSIVDVEVQVVPVPFPFPDANLVLGTASLGRKRVVDRLGWEYERMSADIDEKAIRNDDPMEMPIQIALAKAEAIVNRLRSSQSPPRLIITADQIVLFDGAVREKPASEEEARSYLRSYSNRAVSTVSAIVVTQYPSMKQAVGVDVATVFWEAISEEVVEKVVRKGHVFGCAGGFQIEDEDLCLLIQSIDGGVDSVMGMPVDLTLDLLHEVMEADCGLGSPLARSTSEEQ